MKRKFLKCMIGAAMAMSIIASGGSELIYNDATVVQAAATDVKTITVDGFVIEYETINKGGTIVGYSGTMPEELVIPDQVLISTEDGKRSLPIFTIGEKAFANAKIKKLTLNNILNIIEDKAFYNCTELVEIVSPKCAVKKICKEAFYNCISLNRIDFLRTCEDTGINTVLEEKAFGNCIGLTSLSLATHNYTSDDIKSIFSGCYRLWSVSIQNKKVDVDIEPEYQTSTTGPVVTINGTVVDTSKEVTVKDIAKVEFSDDSKVVLAIYDGSYVRNTENKSVMSMLVNTKKKHTYLAYDDEGNVTILNLKIVDENGNYTEEPSTENTTKGPTTEKPTESVTTEQKTEETTEQSTSETKLSKVKISSVKNIKGKRAKIKFKKVTNGKYQIKISTSKSFKKKLTKTYTTSKTTYTIKKLKKGKTYYVKARAYAKNTKGTTSYGKWSAVKTVKIRK